MSDANKVLNIIIRMKKEGGADKETIQGLANLKTALTQGAAVVGSFVAAYYTADKVLQATVGTLVTLSGEVEKFRNQTGMSAEDSSRLLEVFKDLEISAGDVGTAFKFAIKNGFDPSIQSVMALRDQYLELNPGMERSQFLLKEFGKSGLSLQKFFETGDIAQRLEEINRAMIISDETISKVQEYKDTVDELKDAWEGIKLTIGGDLIGPVTDILKLTTEWETQSRNGYAAWMRYVPVLGSLREMIVGIASASKVFSEETEVAIEGVIGKENDYIIATQEVIKFTDDAVRANYDMEYSLRALNAASQELWLGLGNGTAPSLKSMGAAAFDAMLASDGLYGSMDAIASVGLKEELGLITEAEANAMIMAINFKSALDTLAGMHVTVTVDMIQNLIGGISAGMDPGDLAGYLARGGQLQGVGGSTGNGWVRRGTVNGPGTGSFWENTITGETHIGSTDTGWALGGSFVVPPGYPNDSYHMRVQSGEKVTVTPAGETSLQGTSPEMLSAIKNLESKLDRLPRAIRDAVQMVIS